MASDEEEGSFLNSQYVIIPRDYKYIGSANFTRFDSTYPNQLSKFNVSEETFQHTIHQINEFFADAEALNLTTFLEGCVGCLTFFGVFLCYKPHYTKVLKELEAFIAYENETVYRKHGEFGRKMHVNRCLGLLLLNPLSNGLLELEFKILQPENILQV